jgi:hypothetical protein
MNCSDSANAYYWFNPDLGTGKSVSANPSGYSSPVELKTTEWVISKCRGETGVDVFNRFKQKLHDKAKELYLTSYSSSSSPLLGTNVIISLMDSISRAHFIRTMTTTNSFLNSLRGSGYEVFNFTNYHAVGWNSIQNKAPLFGGVPFKYFSTVKETGTWAKGGENRTVCNNFNQWIYDLYREKGYVSLHGGTLCGVPGNFPDDDPPHYFPTNRTVVDYFS